MPEHDIGICPSVCPSDTRDTGFNSKLTSIQFSVPGSPGMLVFSYQLSYPKVPGKPYYKITRVSNYPGMGKNGENGRFLTNKSLYLTKAR